MDRRNFLRQTGLLLGGLALASLNGKARGQASSVSVSSPASAAGSAPGKKPHVLFIAIEDNAPQRWHTWGNPICQTPNMDRLAATGLKFDLANCMAPPCNPSRTSLLLGLRPETDTVFSNFADWHPRFPTRTTMVQHYKNNGYFTYRVGKIYHEQFNNPADWTLDEDKGTGTSRKRRPLTGPGLRFKNPKDVPFVYGPSGLQDDEEPDGRNTVAIINQLKRTFDQPAFLAIGYHKPHLPFTCPDKYFVPYPPEKMPLAELPAGMQHNQSTHGENALELDVVMTDQERREGIAATYACITFVDAQIGRILDALEQRPDAKEWVICLWADHGFMLGEHRYWCKGPLYDTGVMVPFFMKAPGVTKPGTVCKRAVEMVDVMPTMFDVCGLPFPTEPMEAVSMRTLLENPEAPWKYGARTLSWGAGHRSLRTEQYRYSEYTNLPGNEELWDYATDPKELVNQVKNPKYAAVVKEMHEKLWADWKDLLPAGFPIPASDKLPIKAVPVVDPQPKKQQGMPQRGAGQGAKQSGARKPGKAAAAATTQQRGMTPAENETD